MVKDYRRKASQWSFTYPAFTVDAVDRISKLHEVSEDVLYMTFSILEDDNTGRYLEGFVKMSRRCRVGPLRRLIGPAIVTIVHNPKRDPSAFRLFPIWQDTKIFREHHARNCFHQGSCQLRDACGRNRAYAPKLLRQLLRTTAALHKRHHPAYTTGCLFPNRQRDSRLV